MRKLTTPEFVSMAKDVHGDKFSYKLTEYNGRQNTVVIECSEHGYFEQNAGNHLSGRGCYKCAKESIGEKVKKAATDRRKDIVFSKDGLTIEIPLTQGAVAIADASLYDLLSPFNWCLLNVGYAVTTLKYNKSLLMHSLISEKFFDGHLMDHINRDKLDNRLCNLRIATPQENSCNTRSSTSSKSKYKGVFWYKKHQKWRAQISPGGKKIHLGTFSDEKLAANAYNIKAKELFGDFAFINKI